MLFRSRKKHQLTISNMEPPVRIELTTFRLQGGCSTTELGRRVAGLAYSKIAQLLHFAYVENMADLRSSLGVDSAHDRDGVCSRTGMVGRRCRVAQRWSCGSNHCSAFRPNFLKQVIARGTWTNTWHRYWCQHCASEYQVLRVWHRNSNYYRPA